MSQELQQAQSHIKGLSAQLEAANQFINDQVQSNLQLRTNLILYTQAHQEVSKANSNLIKINSDFALQIKELNEKIVELSPEKDVPLIDEIPPAV